MKQNGQMLVELVLAIGIAAIMLPALITGLVTSREDRPQQQQRAKATGLLKETVTAVRSIRDADWNTFVAIVAGNPYHTVITSSRWAFAANAITTNGFTQRIVMNNVYRDSGGAIVTSGGTLDPSTKKVDVSISWTQPRLATVSASLYLARTTNMTYTETNQSDFNAGTKTTVVVASTSGSLTDGQVQLGAGGGGGDWCQPSKEINQLDLPKSGVANAITAIAGPASTESTVFAGTGENASGVSFAKVDVPGNPPSPAKIAEFDGYKTNAVFGESGYGYLATDNNSKEIVIIDLNQTTGSPPKYVEVGSMNLSGSVNGSSIYVANNKAYVTSSNNKLYIYDVTNRAAPSLLNGSSGLALDGEGKKVLVAGNYAYIATNSTTYQLDIVDVSNTSSPSLVGKLNLGTGLAGVDVYVNTANSSPTRAYIVTSWASGKNDFFIVNVSTKTAPTISGLGSYSTNGMTPKGLSVVTGNKAIIVGTGGTYQYQVVDTSVETLNPLTSCGNLAYATGLYGVASVLQSSGYAYSYVISGDASAELKIILGGAGGSYTSSGTFTSQTASPGAQTAFNRLVATVASPSATTIKMQVASARPSNGNCANATFEYVGPDGSASTYFTPIESTITAVIPFGDYLTNYKNPGYCFRYKAWFTTSDSTQTPVLYDTVLNHSP